MTMPLVSILILTYNQEFFIEDTLESVLKQDYGKLQIVISDDASSDRTPDLIRENLENFPHEIITLFNRENIGVTKNFNQALSHCTGKYIALLDGDDVFLPAKIRRQVEMMENDPAMAISFHDVEVFDSHTKTPIYNWHSRYRGRRVDASDLVRFGPFLPYTSAMLRRECIPENMADERIRVGSDWLFFIETLITCGGKTGWLDEVLARYRRHSENVTSSWDWKIEDQLLTLALVEARWPELAPSARKRKSEVFLIHSVIQFTSGAYKKGFILLWEAYLLSFPWFTSLFRLILRELIFLIRQRGNIDELLRSLLRKKVTDL